MIRRHDLRALQAREVERLRRRRDRDRVRGGRVRHASRTARAGVPAYTSGACTSSATTRAPCRSTIARERAELLGGEHATGRVVRIAQQHRTRAGAERARRWRRDRACHVAVAHRRGDDRPAGQLDDLEERRVRRRRDDDAGAGRDEHVERGRDPAEHVGDREDPRRRHAPAVLAARGTSAHAVRQIGRGRPRRSRSPRGRPRRGSRRAPPARRRSPSPRPTPRARRARRASTSPCGAGATARLSTSSKTAHRRQSAGDHGARRTRNVGPCRATELSYCRICAAACGIVVTVDGDRVVRVRGDDEHPVSRGYTCSKGRGLAGVAPLARPARPPAAARARRRVGRVARRSRGRLDAIIDDARARRGRALPRHRSRLRRRRSDRGEPVAPVDRQPLVLHRGHGRQRARPRRRRARERRTDAEPGLGSDGARASRSSSAPTRSCRTATAPRSPIRSATCRDYRAARRSGLGARSAPHRDRGARRRARAGAARAPTSRCSAALANALLDARRRRARAPRALRSRRRSPRCAPRSPPFTVDARPRRGRRRPRAARATRRRRARAPRAASRCTAVPA